MLQTWTMATPRITGIAERGGSPVESDGGGVLSVLDEAGFVGTLASNSEFEIQRYLHLGEVVSSNTIIDSISDKKTTRLGPGHFVTWVTAFLNEQGSVVGRQRFRVFKFTPTATVSEQATHGDVAGSDRLARGEATHAPRQQDGRDSVPSADVVAALPPAPPNWHQLHVGDALRSLQVDITATVIVAGAIATRDFMPVHHDRDYANAQGAPDIFMNIISSNAYCSRFLTNWTGPETRVHRVSIRLGVPVFPGSTLTFTGKVTGMSQVGDVGTVEVDFRATTELGDHLTGTATVGLPALGEGAERM
jgi:acyl dehydratase